MEGSQNTRNAVPLSRGVGRTVTQIPAVCALRFVQSAGAAFLRASARGPRDVRSVVAPSGSHCLLLQVSSGPASSGQVRFRSGQVQFWSGPVRFWSVSGLVPRSLFFLLRG